MQRIGGPDALSCDEVPRPAPGAGEALIRVEAAGVNFIDVYHRTGRYPLPTPIAIGVEGAGVIEALDAAVGDFAVGDRVAYAGPRGSYAEYQTVPADRLVKLPDEVDTRTGAAVTLQGLTAHFLATTTFALGPEHSCLIQAAAGGVGLLLCQVAKLRGTRLVIGTASTDAKERRAREAGCDHVIRYDRHDFVEGVKRLTDGGGVSVVYDSVGHTTFLKGLDCVRRRGMMVLFGASSGPAEPIDPQVLNQKGSLFLTRPSVFHYIADRDELSRRAHELFAWMRAGLLRVHVDRVLPLERAADAHRALEGRQTCGKVLLAP